MDFSYVVRLEFKGPNFPTPKEVEEYIREAVEVRSNYYRPDDPLHSANVNRVVVRRHKK